MALNLIEQKLFADRPAIPEWVSMLDAIPASLGYIETEELTEIRSQIAEAIRLGNEDKIRELTGKFLDIGDSTVDILERDSQETRGAFIHRQARLKLAFQIISAFTYLAVGNTNHFFRIMKDEIIEPALHLDHLPSQTVEGDEMSFAYFLSNCLDEIGYILDDSGFEA